MRTGRNRIISALLIIVLILSVAPLSLISFAAGELPSVVASLPGSGSSTVFEQDFENVEENKILTTSYTSKGVLIKGLPEIVDGGSDYPYGKVSAMDYSGLDWANISGYPVGSVYTGTADRADMLDYVPTLNDGYVLTLNFCNVTGFKNEYLWICVYDDGVIGKGSQKGFKIRTDQFEAGVWYEIEIKNSLSGALATKTVLTGSNKGAQSQLTYIATVVSGSRYNQFCYTFTPVTSGDVSEERQNAKFLLDSFKLTTEAYNPNSYVEAPIVSQDYEDVENNKVLTQASNGSTKLLMEGVPKITDDAEGYSGGSFADMDYSTYDFSAMNDAEKKYPAGVVYTGTASQSDTLPYVPSAEEGYVLSLDFCNVTGYQDEYLWVNVYSGEGTTTHGYKIPTGQFTADVWYHLEIVAENGVITATKAQLTGNDVGAVTSLEYVSGRVSGSRYNQVMFTMYPKDTTNLVSEGRLKAHFRLDNFSLVTRRLAPISAVISPDSAPTGDLKPFIVSYDSKGVMTSIIEGNLVSPAKSSAAEIYVEDAFSTLKTASMVKVMYWESIASGKPCATPCDISTALSVGGKASDLAVGYLELNSSMHPTGGSTYTVSVYTVPNIITESAVPDFNSGDFELLYVGQQTDEFTSVPYDITRYDSKKQDIVVKIHNGSSFVTTLFEGVEPPTHTNIVIQLGSDETQLNFTWFSISSAEGIIKYAKATEVLDGEMPADAAFVTAMRTDSKKDNHYGNKATITGLERATTYSYQLINGEHESKIYSFTTAGGEEFSFAFTGDPQIGRGYGQNTDNMWGCISSDAEWWGLTLSQMANSSEFSGVSFLMSAGDQINSSLSSYEGHELQTDAYTNHEELYSIPTVTVLGNHDDRVYSVYPFHFNQPNMLTKADGSYYGATYESSSRGGYLKSADYYFTYNGVLFIVLNANTFKATTDTPQARAADKAAADDHCAFVERVMDETAGMTINWTIVLYHQSPYGSSYHGNYSLGASGIFNRNEQYAFVNMREFLLPTLYENGVDLILSGHDHCYTRTHILKPATDEDGNYIDGAVITPYEDGNYVFADGSTTPSYVSWTDGNGVVHNDLKVSSKPVKVTDPDGILHITGATGSGTQANAAEWENPYTAVNGAANKRHLSRIDISENELTIITYNMGTTTTENITEFDRFTIAHTPAPDSPSIDSAAVRLGSDIDLNYYVVPEQVSVESLSMRFTVNGATVTDSTPTLDGERVVFTLDNIAPECMGDNVKAELLVNGEVVAVKDDYSVRQYALSLMASSSDTDLKYLLADMLDYGAACQIEKGYKTDALVNRDLPLSGTDAEPTDSDNVEFISDSKSEEVYLSHVGATSVGTVRIRLDISTDSTANVAVTVNGLLAELSATDGGYIAYSYDISFIDLDKEVVIIIYQNGMAVQRVVYSVNSHLYDMKDESDGKGRLALSLYRFGISAKKYFRK